MTNSGKLDSFMSPIMTDLERLAKEFSLEQFGICRLERPLTMDFYYHWLSEQKHGTMSYLKDHAAMKENAGLLRPLAKSALVFSQSYWPHPEPLEPSPLRLAAYAQGKDYHLWFKEKLNSICQALRELYPDHEFVAMTDSAPVLERDLAHRAALGWFGKNTCLIHPKEGSLFFIGEIYTSLELTNSASAPLPDFCGKCNKCMEICPTGALEKPHVLNASTCISYLTIESKTNPPLELREKMGDWFFGCDLCQAVCPWNQKKFNHTLKTTLLENLNSEERKKLSEELQQILTLSGKKLLRRYTHSPLLRAGPYGLRRNALVVAANQRLLELQEVIRPWQTDPRLGELATWALEKLI